MTSIEFTVPDYGSIAQPLKHTALYSALVRLFEI